MPPVMFYEIVLLSGFKGEKYLLKYKHIVVMFVLKVFFFCALLQMSKYIYDAYISVPNISKSYVLTCCQAQAESIGRW